jgi:hypothetical protein
MNSQVPELTTVRVKFDTVHTEVVRDVMATVKVEDEVAIDVRSIVSPMFSAVSESS